MMAIMNMLTSNRFRIPLLAALATFGLHLVGNPHYGYFRDELYLIICGQHPQWGYVDQPPVAPLLAAGSQIFGHSLVLLRAVPAFFAAAAVYVTCLLAAELGGGAFAQVLAALVVFFAPVLMNFGMKVSPDTVGLWLWPLAALYTLRLVKGADPRGWLAVGAVVGICLQSKYTVVFFSVALLLGLLLTPERRILFSRWFLAGCGVCGLIALPNFLWQVYYGFPTLEFLRNGQHGKNLIVGPGQYLFQQLLITNVFLSLVWIDRLGLALVERASAFPGLHVHHLDRPHGRAAWETLLPRRCVPVSYGGGRRSDRSLDESMEGASAGRGHSRDRFRGSFSFPSQCPFCRKSRRLRTQTGCSGSMHDFTPNRCDRAPAPARASQDWADMHGWPELAATVAKVYQSLSPGDRAQAAIVAGNYGEAAAIDFFGRQYGLPPVISGHNQYYLWGTHGYSGNVVIDVAGDCGAREHLFAYQRARGDLHITVDQPYEDGIPIMVCRGIQRPLAELWPRVKIVPIGSATSQARRNPLYAQPLSARPEAGKWSDDRRPLPWIRISFLATWMSRTPPKSSGTCARKLK